MVSRRDLIGVGLVTGTVALVGGCAPLAARLRKRAPKTAFALPPGLTEPAVRTLGRAGFGHRPGDIRAYLHDGHAASIDRLLRAEVEEDPALVAQIARMDVFRVDAVEMEDLPREAVLRQLRQAAILRAVHGANPLRERMVDFWSDHFNVYGRKEAGAWRSGAEIQNVVRKHALGNFHEMLLSSARSPAMLGYLDNELNRKGAPNENYARELMELHTLGVDGGYTQRDIQEVARCFTGWTVENRFLRPRGKFRYDEERHDGGVKQVLGHLIAAQGEAEGEKVLDMVANHPATGRHLARKLARYFVGEGHTDLESEVAEAYREGKGDIPRMLRPILLHPALLSGPALLKRPMDLVVSSIRALDGTTDGGSHIQDHLTAMGQSPYEWPMPDGYPMKTSAWSGSMLPRWNFAFALAGGDIGGTTLEGDSLSIEERLTALYGRQVDDPQLLGAVRELGLGVAIAAPEFQWR